MRRLASTAAIVLGMPIAVGPASAQTAPNVWTNPNGGSWNNAANWSLDRVPDAFDVASFRLAGPLNVGTIEAVALLLDIEGSKVNLFAPGCGPGFDGLRVEELQVRHASANGRGGFFRLIDADCGDSVADTIMVFPATTDQSGLNHLVLSGSTTLRSSTANLSTTACIGFELDPSSLAAPMLVVDGESYVNAGIRVRPFAGNFPPNGSSITLIDGSPAAFTERTLFPRFGVLEPPVASDLTVQIQTDQEGWDEAMSLKVEAPTSQVATEPIFLDPSDAPVVEIATADFNADGRPDIVSFRQDGSWAIYLQGANGNFVIGAIIQGLEGNITDGTTGDFDGDGTVDVAIGSATSGSSGEVRLYLNAGGGGEGSDWNLGPETQTDGIPVSLARTGPAGGSNFVSNRAGLAVTTDTAGRGRTENYETSETSVEKTGGVEVGDDPETSDPIQDENKKDPDPPIGVAGEATALIGQGSFLVLQPIASSSGGGFELLRTIGLPGPPVDFASADIDQDGAVETLLITANDALVLLRPLVSSTAFATSLPAGATSISLADVVADQPGVEAVIGFDDGMARIYRVALTPTPDALAGDVGVFLELEATLDLPDQIGDVVELVGGPIGHLLSAGKLDGQSAVEVRALDWVEASPCTTFDLDGDGQVDAGDMGRLIGAWGRCRGCAEDFNGDGRVDGEDLALLFSEWGPC